MKDGNKRESSPNAKKRLNGFFVPFVLRERNSPKNKGIKDKSKPNDPKI
jgi:hypothetical protein